MSYFSLVKSAMNHEYAYLDASPSEFKAKPKGILLAFCTSQFCSKKEKIKDAKRNYTVYKHGALKQVDKSVDYCPDCNHALFWTREDEVPLSLRPKRLRRYKS